MKKYFVLLLTVILTTAACSPSTPQAGPTPLPATETPLPTATGTRVPDPTPTSSPTPTPTAAPGGLPDAILPHGLGVSIHYEFFPDTYMPAPQYKLLEEANIGIVRDDMWPGGACAAPPWCFEYFDKLVRNMSKIGVRVVFNLQDYENREIGTEEGRKAFARFAGDAAKNFKGQAVIWEIWNEPDLDGYWRPYSNPKEYALLVEETARAIRAADPDAVIIGPSVSTLSTIFSDNPWKFLNALGKEGTLSRFDAVDVHLYNGGSPESQIENLRRLRRLLDSYSPERKIPVVSTEWGYTTGGEYYRHRSSPEEQPKYLVRSFLVKAAHEINLSIWYDWKNDDWDPNGEAERHFGVITSSGEPKPAYRALQTLTTTLDGHQFVRRLATDSSHDYLFLFRKGNSGVLVAWTITDAHEIQFPGMTGAVQSIGMSGEKQMLEADEQGLSLQISDSPQYLLLPEGFFGNESVFWKPDGTFFRLDDAGHTEIPILLENPSDHEQTFGLQAGLNSKTIGAAEVVLKPHEERTIQLPLDIDPGSDAMDFLIEITVDNQEIIQSAWVWIQK